jgi:hypothetical protein
MWAGQACYIVGGGPSLKGFDWDLLKGLPNIMVLNKAFSSVPWADMCFVEDARFIRRFGEELVSFAGKKVWHVALGTNKEEVQAAVNRDPHLELVYETRSDKYWSKSFCQGLSSSSNAAVGAINVADLFDADPIYLMGIDCRAENQNMGNFHNSYPREWAVGAMQALNFKSDFENWVQPHTKHRRIINLVNPAFESTIEGWPKEQLAVHFGR